MNKYIEIQDRKIGMDFVPLVVAEIGINHGGSLKLAKKMVKSAKRAGAEIIKHQTHIVESEMSDEAKKVVPGNSTFSIYKIMERCQLSEKEEYELMQYTKSLGMIFISTPFSFSAVDRLEKFGVPAYKIGSGEMNNLLLVNYIASKMKPIIISTGMNHINSVKLAIAEIKKYHSNFVILHTTNLYPTPFDKVRLGALQDLQKNFPEEIIGLSDHTITNNACISAIALGASVVERHFTDKKSRKGEDIVCSMDEKECAELIKASKEIFLMRGGKKEPVQEEQVTMNFAFNTVVASKDIKKGEVLSLDNLTTKRPGNLGIPAQRINELLNQRAKRDIPYNTHIDLKDIE